MSESVRKMLSHSKLAGCLELPRLATCLISVDPGRNGWLSFLDCDPNTRWLNAQLCILKARRLVSTLSRCRLQPAYDVLHLGGEINVMMHDLPAPCFSAINIRDATLEPPPLTGEGCLDAFRAYRVG